MKYLFILGRNIELSIQEVLSYLRRENLKILDFEENQNSLLVELDKELKKNIISEFGGVLAIAKILVSAEDLDTLLDDLEKKELYFGKNNKLNYVLWNFGNSENSEEILDYLKQRFKQEKIKATEKKLTGKLELQNGKEVNIATSNLLDSEFVFFENKNFLNFGKIVEKCDYSEIEKRDLEKPVRRESLAISPRLAKIMINLSEAKPNEKLLDPFCGVGVVLQEALLKKIRCIGIDIDSDAIQSARKNLGWFKFSSQNYKLLKGDSSKLKVDFCEICVFEPDFGELQRKMVNDKKAKLMLEKFEDLLIAVLHNIAPKISKKIVFTAPLIKTNKGRLKCDLERVLQGLDFKVQENFPIEEFRKRQIVGREIIVLSKNL